MTLNYRIPGHFIYMSLHKKATIVIYLVLQSTPTYVNAVAGYSIIAPNMTFNFMIMIEIKSVTFPDWNSCLHCQTFFLSMPSMSILVPFSTKKVCDWMQCHQAGSYLGFHSIEWLGVFVLSTSLDHDGMPDPQHFNHFPVPSQLKKLHLGGERHCAKKTVLPRNTRQCNDHEQVLHSYKSPAH